VGNIFSLPTISAYEWWAKQKDVLPTTGLFHQEEIFMFSLFKSSVIIPVALALMTTSLNVLADVKWLDKEIEVGDQLYTRGLSDDCKSAKVYRKTVTYKDAEKIKYSMEMAIIKETDQDIDSPEFEEIHDSQGLNICKQGGCYTKLEEPIADIKHWFANKEKYCKK
jgi:hypothetical protein